LIHCLYEGTTIPPLFAWEDEDADTLCIVDGQQRLCALFEYMNDEFRVTQSNMLDEKGTVSSAIEGRYYSELEPEDQNRLKRYVLRFELIHPPTSGRKADMLEFSKRVTAEFHRLNTTSNNMTKAEIWNSTYRGKAISLAYAVQGKMGFRRPEPNETTVNMKDALANYWLAVNGVVSRTDILRMQDIDLILQLLYAMDNGGEPVNKEDGLGEWIRDNMDMPATKYDKMLDSFMQVISVLSLIDKRGCSLADSEYSSKHDFYSIFCAIHRMLAQGVIPTGDGFKTAAGKLLAFSTLLGSFRENQAGTPASKRKHPAWEDVKIPETRKALVMNHYLSRLRDWSSVNNRKVRMETIMLVGWDHKESAVPTRRTSEASAKPTAPETKKPTTITVRLSKSGSKLVRV
jgi:hypothetical protein